jgi:PRTRC genetic system ThiF family protein
MKQRNRAHFVDSYLRSPGNPIIVNLIGGGGSGSQMMSALYRINQSLLALDHPGLFVRCFDGDTVTAANPARQLFTKADIGKNKAVTLINRFNRAGGTNWKAMPHHYSPTNLYKIKDQQFANITISCVDDPGTRFEIASMLTEKQDCKHSLQRPIYWIDFGNSRDSGQMVLSTISKVEQPKSKKYEPVAHLPLITVEYKTLLENAPKDSGPSCSLAEALTEQDLFVNSALIQTGCSLIWKLFSDGVLFYRGFFQNLKDLKSNPIPV